MIAAAALQIKWHWHTYHGWLTFVFAIVFKVIFLALMDTFETREFILSQIAYTFKSSSCNAPMQSLMSLTFILPYISNTV